MNLSDVTIRVSDVRKAGICLGPRGAFGFWRQHGWDFKDFLENGIAAQRLWDTGDGYARLVVTRKLAREATDG